MLTISFVFLNSALRSHYADFCYECLPPLVFSLSRAERVKFDNFFEALQKVGGLSEATKNNNDLAKWAFNVVYTRVLGTGEEKS